MAKGLRVNRADLIWAREEMARGTSLQTTAMILGKSAMVLRECIELADELDVAFWRQDPEPDGWRTTAVGGERGAGIREDRTLDGGTAEGRARGGANGHRPTTQARQAGESPAPSLPPLRERRRDHKPVSLDQLRQVHADICARRTTLRDAGPALGMTSQALSRKFAKYGLGRIPIGRTLGRGRPRRAMEPRPVVQRPDTIICKLCGAEVPNSRCGRDKLYCSDKCRIQRDRQAFKEARAAKTAALPRTVTCCRCGTEFERRSIIGLTPTRCPDRVACRARVKAAEPKKAQIAQRCAGEGCDRLVPPRALPGPPKLYCGKPCMKRASRDRLAVARGVPPPRQKRFEQCQNCGGPMDLASPRLKYCSDQCARRTEIDAERERRRALRAERRAKRPERVAKQPRSPRSKPKPGYHASEAEAIAEFLAAGGKVKRFENGDWPDANRYELLKYPSPQVRKVMSHPFSARRSGVTAS